MMNTFYAPTLAGMIYAMPGMETQAARGAQPAGRVTRASRPTTAAPASRDMRFRFYGRGPGRVRRAGSAQAQGERPVARHAPTTSSSKSRARRCRRCASPRSTPACSTRIVKRCVEPGTPCMSDDDARWMRGDARRCRCGGKPERRASSRRRRASEHGRRAAERARRDRRSAAARAAPAAHPPTRQRALDGFRATTHARDVSHDLRPPDASNRFRSTSRSWSPPSPSSCCSALGARRRGDQFQAVGLAVARVVHHASITRRSGSCT